MGTDNGLWSYLPQLSAAPSMHLIDLIEKELQAFGKPVGRFISHTLRGHWTKLGDGRVSDDKVWPRRNGDRESDVVQSVRHMEYALMCLKKLTYMIPLAIALGVTGNALAQTSPPKTDDKAPVAGANSFTEGQAKSRIEGAGFTKVTGLKKDDKGVWRGSAMQKGKQVTVSVDFRGNVVSP